MKRKIIVLMMLLLGNLSFSKVIDFNKPNNGNEIENILINKKISIIEFYVDGCKPCLKMKDVLENVSNGIEVDIVKINADKYRNVAQLYNVNSYPRIIILKEGNIINEIRGTRSVNELKQEIVKSINVK